MPSSAALRLCGFEVGRDLAGVGDVVVGQHVGVGHAQGFEAEDARHLLEIDEVRVGVLDVPGVVVEGGVIDAVGAVGADIGGGHAERAAGRA